MTHRMSQIATSAGWAVLIFLGLWITKCSTLFEFSNLKSSLKFGGSGIVAIDNLVGDNQTIAATS
jgi:hypothetical protein